MDTFEAIRLRRSVKKYDPDHRLTEEEVDRLFQAAILSPTSFNMQNWRFLLVEDPALRQKIREASFNQAQVTEASLLVFLTADLNAFKKEPERYWRNAPENVAKMMVEWMVGYYDSNEQLKRDEAVRSCGIAAQTLMLAAKAMGYDSCPMIGFEPEKVAELIHLPDDHILVLMLVVGKAKEPARERPGQIPLEEVLFRDRFPD